MATNVDILTRSHTVLKAKARAKRNQIDQIVFDEDARREYLTGFRKRNLLKKENAKSKAKERERQERLQARREQRQALQEQARENAALVEGAFQKVAVDDGDGDDAEPHEEEFTGFSSPDKGKGKATQEYEDEEQLATVTVVEEFDPDSLKHSPSTSRHYTGPDISPRHPSYNSSAKPRDSLPHSAEGTAQAKTMPTKSLKAKPKKIAYETKAARKASRQKQRARKTEKADLAGGRPRQKERRGGKGKGRKGK